MTAHSPSRNGVLQKAVALIVILAALVAMVTFAVSADLKAETALETGRDRETRLRDVEQAQTKTSTKLDAIHETVKDIKAKLDHMDRKEQR